MALFENFPYTNLQQLNLDWLIDQLNKISESSVLSVNGQTGVVTLYENAQMVLPNVPEDNWTIIRMCDGTYRGILFGNDDKAYIVHDNLMAQIYSQNNQPPYPVTRVNGQYGDVVLYPEQYVRLPDLDDIQMTNWTFFRMLNNKSHGIQFEDDGTAYIINGTQRYVLYTSNNPPTFPVDSVNGQTGTVVLFTDTNGNVSYPAFTDPNYEGWSINRSVNGTNVGLEFKEDGSLVLKVGAAEYTVYTSNEEPAHYVEDASESIQNVTEPATNGYWGLMRETATGDIGVLFNNADPDEPKVFLAYTDSNDQSRTVRLMTSDDIPSSGVITINGQAGIVVLYGSDLDVSSGDSRTLDTAIEDAEKKVAFVESSNIATRNYSESSFIIMNNTLYRVTTPISSGDTLIPNTNLAMNSNIGEQIRVLRGNVSTLQDEKAEVLTAGSFSTSTRVKCAGYLTSGGNNLHFFYPRPVKSGLSVSSMTINNVTARGVTGYVLDNVSNFTGWTNSAYVVSNTGIHFIMSSPSSLGSNNTPVTVEIDASVTLG